MPKLLTRLKIDAVSAGGGGGGGGGGAGCFFLQPAITKSMDNAAICVAYIH